MSAGILQLSASPTFLPHDAADWTKGKAFLYGVGVLQHSKVYMAHHDILWPVSEFRSKVNIRK